MFCPQCGNNIPDGKLLDGAAFCPKCGTKIEQRTTQRPTVVNRRGTIGTSVRPNDSNTAAGFTPYQIGVLVFGLFALLFAFLPWFESSSSLLTAGNVGSALGQFGSAITGSNYNVASFSESYSVFSFMGLINDLSFYSSYVAGRYGGYLMFTFLAWILAVALIVAGIIGLIVTSRHTKALLIIGVCVLMTLCLLWFSFYGYMAEGYGIATGSPVFAFLCILSCIIAISIAIVAKATNQR